MKVLSGEITMNLSGFKTTPLPAGLTGFSLLPGRVVFTPARAEFSGQAALATTCEPPSGSSGNSGLSLYLAANPVLTQVASSAATSAMIPVAAATPVPPASQPGGSMDFRFANLQKVATAPVATSNVLATVSAYCRPDPRYSYPVSGTLQPETGDLYGKSDVSLSGLKVPNTPFALGGNVALTLDLSAAQNNDALNGVLPAYDQVPDVTKPAGDNTWMGLLLEKAQVGLEGARSAPLTATLRSGFTFVGALGVGNFTDRGWTFALSGLNLTVAENHLVNKDGQATTKLPMFEEVVPVTLTMQDGKLNYALAGAVSHDFGRSTVGAAAGCGWRAETRWICA